MRREISPEKAEALTEKIPGHGALAAGLALLHWRGPLSGGCRSVMIE
jgi:hypothetical protein